MSKTAEIVILLFTMLKLPSNFVVCFQFLNICDLVFFCQNFNSRFNKQSNNVNVSIPFTKQWAQGVFYGRKYICIFRCGFITTINRIFHWYITTESTAGKNVCIVHNFSVILLFRIQRMKVSRIIYGCRKMSSSITTSRCVWICWGRVSTFWKLIHIVVIVVIIIIVIVIVIVVVTVCICYL